ncbi:MAG TPA: thioredoxin domain-containing protein [Candidatus Hydrogenedens sp.]|nr:thioredoxin domain-containing protein [Candidatus Hydrogenedens sp.]HOK09430.1 thioredoxin domain-containing protein [Candidatus Hydrogenedens sp.]HOL18979.1 thioredoxin domain-containing protein [Candidatus Hydrogenedens sp.]HPP58969.1 thioredoxin domain-containing protein [Candidatus Hydrogenedens sp.]
MGVNRLKHSKSLYLQSHADDLVDWYPWSREALKKAKDEHKPIFLSIGYSACHWCHVMQNECFRNEEIATLLNQAFVSIKVDREEYPHIDEMYMHFVVQTTGNGGWPLSVFLTPDLKPFFGGTYFPPFSIGSHPGFTTILRYIIKIWNEQKEQIEIASSKFIETIQAQLASSPPVDSDVKYKPILENAYTSLVKSFDKENSGWGMEPKFPPTLILQFLLNYSKAYRSHEAWEIVYKTLITLALSGIFDHIGGGFHRYCTDRIWHIPHFEKMLYDNAQLANLYIDAYAFSRFDFFRYIAQKTLTYLIRELHSSNDGFYSSQDADSEHIEGKYYVWSYEEIQNLLGADTNSFCNFFGVEKEGNWKEPYFTEPQHISRGNILDPKYAGMFHKGYEYCIERYMRYQPLLHHLYLHREKRVKPLVDNKCVSSWNALAISVFAKSACILNSYNELYQKLAVETAKLYLAEFDSYGFLPHILHNSDIEGLLEDYTLFTSALLDLYELTLDKYWLNKAMVLVERWIDDFSKEDEIGYYHVSSKQRGDFPIQTKPIFDQQEPSGNASAGFVLARIGRLVSSEYLDLAGQLCSAYINWIQKAPNAFPSWLHTLLYLEHPAVECTIFGKGMHLYPQPLLSSIYSIHYPFFIFKKCESSISEPQDAIAMFCFQHSCSPPIYRIDEIPTAFQQILKL